MLALENSKLGEYFYFINTAHTHTIIVIVRCNDLYNHIFTKLAQIFI